MKKFILYLIFSLFSVLIISSYNHALASEVDDAIVRVQKAYEGVKDIKGTFVQKSVIKDLGKTEMYNGDFFIKPPLKMKWVYKGKTGQELTVNNDTVLIYKKEDKQAYRGSFDRETYGQTPVALLSGFGKIRDEFHISGTANSILLKPKKPMGSVVSIRMTISDEGFPIKSFVITDSHSNTIDIRLKDVVTNTGLEDSLFSLTVPKGVNVLEQ